MKSLIFAAALLALAAPAHATEATDIRTWEELNNGCQHGGFPDDEDVDVHSTQKEYDRTARGKACIAAKKLEKKLAPYQEGMRDYREGLCYRARPYIAEDRDPARAALWEKGWNAHQTAKIAKRRDAICFPGRNGTKGH